MNVSQEGRGGGKGTREGPLSDEREPRVRGGGEGGGGEGACTR